MIKKFLLSAVALMISIASYAVTDREMEQARTITAQTYLRYANDGSDYLDKFEAVTMSELEGKLKKTEQENIKAVKSVAVPKDYASWDKAKMVEYWSVTFFKSPGLTDKGKIGRAKVKRRLEAMTVSAPAASATREATAPAETSNGPVVTLSDNAEAVNPASQTEAAENVLQESQQIAEDAVEEIVEEVPARNSSDATWIYVVILVVLVGVVIWLVVFAANIMKKNGVETKSSVQPAAHNESAGKLLDRRKEATEKNNQQVEEVSQAADNSHLEENLQLRRQLERMEAVNSNLTVDKESALREVDNLRRENAILLQEVEKLRRRERERSAAAQENREGVAPPREMPLTIYLGRVNQNGLFIRADRRMNVGNTVYRLDTKDGVTGTFRVVSDPAINSLIMADPAVMLGGGCTADPDTDLEGKSRVVNEKSGTAVLENNCWKVLRKAKVRFE